MTRHQGSNTLETVYMPFLPYGKRANIVEITPLVSTRTAREARGEPFHIMPYSTLIACMGTNWSPGSRLAVENMAKHTAASGIMTKMYEIPDLCYIEGDALGTMRNEAYVKAMQEGWEFILYVDNDVLPDPDTLISLLGSRMELVVPIPEFRVPDSDMASIDHALTVHKMERDQGLAVIRSSVISFVLAEMTVFNRWDTGDFWDNAIGAHEAHHFAKFRNHGHRLFVDTNVVVPILKPPHFPLDHRPETSDPLWKR